MERPRTWCATRWLGLVLALIVLASPASRAQDGIVLADGSRSPSVLRGATSDVLLYEGEDDLVSQPRCLAHEGSVPSQALHLSGSISGLVLGPVVVNGATVASRTPADSLTETVHAPQPQSPVAGVPLGPLFADLVATATGPDDGVVILVPDDFTPGRFDLAPALFGLVTGMEAEVQGILNKGGLSHGALVLHHLNALIAATGAYVLDTSVSGNGTFRWLPRSGSGPTILVRGLFLDADEDGRITTTEIADTMATAMAELDHDEDLNGATLRGAVVNMSWVLLPCRTVDDFEANRDQFATFQDYMSALGRANFDLSAAELEQAFKALLTHAASSEDLLVGMQRAARGASNAYWLAFAAAAGNFELPYQMLPAAWTSVVGVGSYADGDPPPPFSNIAEVLAPGAWFELEPLGGSAPSSAGVTASSVPISYAGTSFAVPYVSLFLGLDMAAGSRCTGPAGAAPGLSSDPPAGAWLSEAQHVPGPALRPGAHCPY